MITFSKMKRVSSFILLGIVIVSCSVKENTSEETDLLLTNGKILSVDASNTIATEVRIRGNIIVAMGKEALKGKHTKVIDLKGRTVIPGLIDSHLHFIRQGLAPGHDVREAETVFTVAELLALLHEKAKPLPEDEFVTVVGGIGPEQFKEQRMPTLAEMDEAVPQHPVYLQEGFSGPASTNSKGKAYFQKNGMKVKEDGTFAQGKETNSAFAVLRANQSFEDKKRASRNLMRFANSVGLTMVLDEAGVPFPGPAYFDPKRDYQPFLDLWRHGETTVRVRIQHSVFDQTSDRGDLEEKIENTWMLFGNDMLRITGTGEHVVTFPREGKVNPAYLQKVQKLAQDAWSHEQHSVSHAENMQHLAAIEAVQKKYSINELRWSLAHVFELGMTGTEELLERLKSMKMGLRLQNQAYTAPTNTFPFGRSLGGDNAGPLFRRLVDSGIPLGAGTDGAMLGPMNPWLSIYYMVTGKDNTGKLVNPGQTINRIEALRLYTIGSAWFSFDDDQLGSIEPGKLADIIVLNKDYLEVPEKEIKTIKADLTIVDGCIVHAASEFAKHMQRND